MNKNLIQKFLIQSCWDEQDEIELEDWINVERFAELIVKECVLISRTSTDGFSAGKRMEEHFGVE
jgi:hypothetical protein